MVFKLICKASASYKKRSKDKGTRADSSEMNRL
ncbi:hypothetical protein SAMN05444405_1243 [Bacteroides luti]|uniref:Uncharacterized protein n=1 Tax=Bacteroides luti TaxID=1297750 RepID=A0A1M5H4Q5_9BACE|nr:hypothetical protein SAMN05444405_1243 [Bacteroides luti]